MSDFGHLTDAQLAAIAAQSSPASTGTSPPASLPPVDARANRDVTPSPSGGFDDAQGNNYFPAVAGHGLLADSKGNIYRQTVPDDFQHLSDQDLEQLANRMHPGRDLMASLGSDVGKSLAGVGGAIGDLQNLYGNAVNYAGGKLLGGKPEDFRPGGDFGPRDFATDNNLPTSDVLNGAIQSATGKYYDPQTALGRAGQAVIGFAPAMLGEGTLATRLSRALVPAGFSDAAGETARKMFPGNAGAESLARTAGGLAGGVGQLGGEAIVNAPQRALSKALGGMTPDTLDNLTALLQSSRNLPGGGISLTPAEAGAQVGLPQLAKIQHFIENTPQGGDALGAFFTKRPGEVSATSKAMADMLAPARSDPSLLGVETQGAANSALGAVRKGINDRAGASYEALRGQDMPAADYAGLSANPSYAKALETFRGNPELGGPYAGLPDQNLAVVNEVQKQLDAMAESAKPGEFNPGGNHQLEAARVSARQMADALARHSSPDYAAARDTVSQGRQAELAPLQAGPLGTMAGSADVPTQTGALFKPANVGGANETVQAIQHLAGQDPSLPPQLVSQYLRNTSNDALANLQGGANEWGGARLGVRLGGTEERRAALLGGTQAAGGDAGQMADFLDALSATGKRLPVGSRTYFNEEMAKELGVPQGGFSSWTDPLTYGHMINNAVGGALYNNRVEGLAKFLMGDDPAAQRAFLERAQAMRGRQLGSALMLEGSQHP